MNNVLKIQQVINQYRAYKEYKEMLEKEQPETIKYYKVFEMGLLRELAELKAESPNSFRFACALDKLIMN